VVLFVILLATLFVHTIAPTTAPRAVGIAPPQQSLFLFILFLEVFSIYISEDVMGEENRWRRWMKCVESGEKAGLVKG
jgi:hypothetical protein